MTPEAWKELDYQWALMPGHLRARFKDFAKSPTMRNDCYLVGYIGALFATHCINQDMNRYALALVAGVYQDQELQEWIKERIGK